MAQPYRSAFCPHSHTPVVPTAPLDDEMALGAAQQIASYLHAIASRTPNDIPPLLRSESKAILI
jgi:hypothetical protein